MIFNNNYIEILKNIDNINSISDLMRKTNISYSTLLVKLKCLEDNGLLVLHKTTHIVTPILTDKGERIRELIITIISELQQDDIYLD